MTVYFKVKALAKRKPLIERTPFEVANQLSTSNQLVEYIVRRNVEDFNNKAVDTPLFQYLSAGELEGGAAVGKVGFGGRKNENRQDADKAVENALSCYQDGIFKLFINDTETEYNKPVALNDGDEITFIRLTMLAGRLW